MKLRRHFLLVVLALVSTGHLVNSGTLHVWQDSPNPMSPFTNWATAARTIQEAVDTSADGDTVLVTNGVYASGGKALDGSLTNRVCVDRTITLLSVNGPEVTVIKGEGSSQLPWVRCVFLGPDSSLSGFTLTNGYASYGGGLWSSPGGVVSNCVLTLNYAEYGGGGAYGGILRNCTLSRNDILEWEGRGGGAAYSTLTDCAVIQNGSSGVYASTLYNCTLTGNGNDWGGGADHSTLYNCRLTGNTALHGGGAAADCWLYECIITDNSARLGHGGGVAWSTLYGCVLAGNTAMHEGGGALRSTLYNCVLSSNSARKGGGAAGSCSAGHNEICVVWDPCILYNCTLTGNSAEFGGGVAGGLLYNCIVFDNSSPNAPNHFDSTFSYSCTTPLPENGVGNIHLNPGFLNAASGDFRLDPDSPCIDTGSDLDLGDGTYLSTIITIDLDGNPRPLDGDGEGVAQFDMGAFEFVSPLIPSEAIQELILAVEGASLENHRTRALQASLFAILASMNRGQTNASVNQLKAFQNKAKAQMARQDGELAEDLIGAAQEIIDVLLAPEPEPEPNPSQGQSLNIK